MYKGISNSLVHAKNMYQDAAVDVIAPVPTLYVSPYESVGPIRFGMTAKEVEGAAGEPIVIRRNQFGETDYKYFALSIRLSATGMRVVEVRACHPTDVRLDAIHILKSTTALKALCERDRRPFKCAGFVILPNLGFALTGFANPNPNERVLTAFARGRWEGVLQRYARRFYR